MSIPNKERGTIMEREICFRIPSVCRKERIISVDYIGVSGDFLKFKIKSCDPDFTVAAHRWLTERDLLPYVTTKVFRGFTAVVNKQGRLGIACYHEGDSIPYSSYLGVYLATADSFGVKERMMKEIGMV